jgi:hypothetical protein
MARDLAEQERAFVLALAPDTGRDLETWMQAIAASGLGARNDIIDWLRHQGFTFSNASWLERIHHNGGRLIYAQAEPRGGAGERPTAAKAKPAEVAGPEPSPLSPEREPEPQAAAPPELCEDSQVEQHGSSDAEIAALLLTAKGLRPLADFILREMDQIVPALVRVAEPPLLTLASPMPFAALLPGPKEVRLFADFGATARDRTKKADSARLPAPFPDVLILNDARQIDGRFRELIALAYTRALT